MAVVDERIARHRVLEHDGREGVAETFTERHARMSSLSPRPCEPPMLSAREKLYSM